MRADGRTSEHLRPVRITPDFIPTAEGSVLIEIGGTRVICNATVEDGVPSFRKGSGKGWVTAEYGMLPRATGERMRREAAQGKQSGRTQEIQRLIGRSLRAVTDLEKLGPRTIQIDCDVLQADGGTRTAGITGAYVALADAVGFLLREKKLAASPLREAVAAVSVGIVDGRPVLDLDYAEDSEAGTDANFVMTGNGGIVEVQGTAETLPFSQESFDVEVVVASEPNAVAAQRLPREDVCCFRSWVNRKYGVRLPHLGVSANN